jgi:hypothetical protein
VIFVLLAVAWAVYLIPKALKHHDEVARTRSIDRFSSAMRVLARREPVNEKDSRLVVTSRRATAAPAPTPEPERRAQAAADPRESRVRAAKKSPRPDRRRTSARKAARRRRRILGFLLLCDIGVAAAAYLAYLQWWTVAVPGALTLTYLVLCRTQVRHENVRPVRAPAPPPVVAASPEEPLEEPVEQLQAVVQGVVEPVDADFDETEDTIGIPVAQLQAAAAVTADGTTLWDPLPMTLPTYVSAPKAKRTVRTIDLGQPGTWTSGRTAEDAEIAARAEAARKTTGEDGQAAVGG